MESPTKVKTNGVSVLKTFYLAIGGNDMDLIILYGLLLISLSSNANKLFVLSVVQTFSERRN